MWRRLWVCAALLGSCQAWAGINDVMVDKVWMHESVPGQQDAKLQLNLSVTKGARLLSVSSPAAAGGEIQRFVRHHGRMEKRTVPSIRIAPRSTVSFGERNVYLVLTGLKQPLNVGDHVPIVLVVQMSGGRDTINTVAEVKAIDLSYQQYNNRR